MLKNLLAGVVGAGVTFVLVVFMTFMVKQTAERKKSEDDVPLEIAVVERETETKLKVRQVPKKPPPPKRPPPAKTVVQQENRNVTQQVPQLNFANLSIGFRGEGAYIGGFRTAGARDAEAVPIVRIEPQYPDKAAREGTEGYVTLSFTINPDGTVGEIEIIDAQPRRIFNRAAKRALSRWKYRPKMVDGKAMAQPGQTVKLDFKLDS